MGEGKKQLWSVSEGNSEYDLKLRWWSLVYYLIPSPSKSFSKRHCPNPPDTVPMRPALHSHDDMVSRHSSS